MVAIKVYKIVYKNPQNPIDTECYIGSTKMSLKRRFNQHRFVSLFGLSKLYKKMRDCGIANFAIELIETRECYDFKEQRSFEREIFDREKPTLNTNKPLLKHDEKLTEKREFYARNRQNINARRCESIKCRCGKQFTLWHKARHEKTDHHQNNQFAFGPINIPNNIVDANHFIAA
jgi:hypothetical protein